MKKDEVKVRAEFLKEERELIKKALRKLSIEDKKDVRGDVKFQITPAQLN